MIFFNTAKINGTVWDIANDPICREKFRAALQEGFRRIGTANPKVQAKIQELESSADFAALVKVVTDSVKALGDAPDEGYKLLFDFRDDTNRAADGFTVHNVVNGITWQRYQPGEPIVPTKVTGTDITVTYYLYSALHEYRLTDFQDGDWYSIEDESRMFALKYYQVKAQYFYGLLEATSQSQSFAGSAGQDTYYRDIQTIDAACAAIINNMKDYGVTSASRFFILAPEALRRRILAALSATMGAAPNANYAQVSYNVTPIFSNNLTSNSYYYVVLPKLTLKAGERMLMTLSEPMVDIRKAGGVVAVAGNARFGGAVGSDYQVVKCATS